MCKNYDFRLDRLGWVREGWVFLNKMGLFW